MKPGGITVFVGETGPVAIAGQTYFTQFFTEETNFELVPAVEKDAETTFRSFIDERKKVQGVIFSSGLSGAPLLAQKIRALEPQIAFIFLAADEVQQQNLQRELKYTPYLGEFWLIVKHDELIAFKPEMLRVFAATMQRYDLRTTIGAVRQQLQVKPAPDVPEYRRLMLSERYFKNVLESAEEAIFVTDQDGRISIWNKGAENLCGLTSEEAVGKYAAEIMRGELASKIPALLEVAAKNQPIREEEVKCENHKGEELIVSLVLSPVRDDLERQIGISFFIVDRTETVRKRQIADNEKARMLASINSLSLGFLMTDTEDRVIASNKAMADLFEVDSNPFTDIQKLHDYFKDEINLNEYYQKCKHDKVSQKIENVCVDNCYLRLFFAPILTAENDFIGVVILIEDVTEAMLLEREKDDIFIVASHELRTPLTAIRGYSSLITTHFADIVNANPDLAKMITNINLSSVRLINIVSDFLDASKLEQGKFTLDVQSIALTPIIENVVTDLTQLAGEKGIFIKFEKHDDMPNVLADTEKMKQIIYNLVGNAIKFTEKGGITIYSETHDDYVKVFIRDTGLGISDKYKGLLFRKFQQAGERILTRDAATGSGMGLYITKLLLEAMKGSIAIEESTLNIGSTFSFTLPIAKNYPKEVTTGQ